jgi:hypothetical protein
LRFHVVFRRKVKRDFFVPPSASSLHHQPNFGTSESDSRCSSIFSCSASFELFIPRLPLMPADIIIKLYNLLLFLSFLFFLRSASESSGGEREKRVLHRHRNSLGFKGKSSAGILMRMMMIFRFFSLLARSEEISPLFALFRSEVKLA